MLRDATMCQKERYLTHGALQKQKENDRCGTRTHSLSLRRAARYHCANRPGLLMYDQRVHNMVHILHWNPVHPHCCFAPLHCTYCDRLCGAVFVDFAKASGRGVSGAGIPIDRSFVRTMCREILRCDCAAFETSSCRLQV